MPSIKDVDKLIINTVENETVYKYMEDNNLLQEDELYLVAGDSLPPITEEDNGKVLGVTNGEWQVVDQTSPLTPGTDYLTPTQISNSYVAKVSGKGLSTNDLTNELKAQYDKAEQNVQSDWNQTTTSSDDYIKNKPTKLSDFTDDLGTSPTHTHSQYITDISGKVDKVSGKGLSSNDLTNTLKTNYDAAYTHSQSTHAPSDAEKNVQSDWNVTDANSDAFIKNKPSIPTKMSDLEQDVETGKIDAIKVNNVAQTITNKTVNISVPTALSQLTGDATHRTVTDEQITKWNNSEIPDEYVYADELVDSNITGNPLDAGTLGGYSASDFQLKSQMPAVPTKVSQLSNDRGYVTNTELPTVPRLTSQLTNDSGFITASELPTMPTKLSQLANDSGFITVEDIPDSTHTVHATVLDTQDGTEGNYVSTVNLDVSDSDMATWLEKDDSIKLVVNDNGETISMIMRPSTEQTLLMMGIEMAYAMSTYSVLGSIMISYFLCKYNDTWSIIVLQGKVPKKTSDLTNDSGFITNSSLSTYAPLASPTFTGAAKVSANTNYATAQLRNIIISTADPSGGSNGDIWIKYEA